MERACKECGRITDKPVCPICKVQKLSSDWSGMVIIIDPRDSVIGEKINAKTRGRFALRVR